MIDCARVMTHYMPPLSRELHFIGKDEEAPMFEAPKGVELLSLSREGFAQVAMNLKCKNKRVLIPAYTCYTCYEPFAENGWEYEFYKFDRRMRIVCDDFLKQVERFRPDVVVVHPYYGQDLNADEQAVLRKAKEMGVFIIEDRTQIIDSKRRYDFVDAYTGSIRKWYPIPDGGFYYSKVLPMAEEERPEHTEFVEAYRDAQYLNGVRENYGDPVLTGIAHRLNEKLAEGYWRHQKTELHQMSAYSRRILKTFDMEAYENQRLENARYLWDNLKDNPNFEMVYASKEDITTGPLFFAIYMKGDALELRKDMFKDTAISTVTMWRPKDENQPFLISDDVKSLYFNMLQLPIGLDYGKDEMDRILAAMNR